MSPASKKYTDSSPHPYISSNFCLPAADFHHLVLLSKLLVKMGKNSRRTDEFCSLGSGILTKRGFRIVLLNTAFGLLPVTWRGNYVHYSFCSIPSIYSLFFFFTMMYISVLFVPLSLKVYSGNQSDNLSATDMAITVARCIHIIGFLSLVCRGRSMAKVMPKLWIQAATVVQRSSLHLEKTRKSRRKLQRFTLICMVIYVCIVLMKELNIMAYKREQIVLQFTESYGSIDYETEGWKYWFLLLGYFVWDCTTVTHGLVSMLLTFFVITLGMCLKSLNEEIKLVVEKWSPSRKSMKKIPACDHLPTVSHPQPEIRDPEELSGSMNGLGWKLNEIKETYWLVESILDTLSSSFGTSIVIEQLIVTGALVANLFFMYNQLFYQFRGCTGTKGEEASPFLDSMLVFQDAVAHPFFFFCLTVASSRLTTRVCL